MEWAIMARLEGQTKFYPLNGDNGMPAANPLVSDTCRPKGVVALKNQYFLSNGARYYHDVGGHVEYATPENRSLDDAVLSELAGEWIAADSLRQFIASHATVDEAILYKRVVDDRNETWGYHVNISEDRFPFIPVKQTKASEFLQYQKDSMKPLVLHYATSLPMLGGGAVQLRAKDGQTYKYSLGQKVIDVRYDVTDSTTRSKPFISARDEPHADKEKYIRVHIVGTDPHISPWATRMMIGTTTLMLAGMRQGKVRSLQFDSQSDSPAILIAAQAKYDIEGNNRYPFVVGGESKKYSATDIQEMYIDDLERVSDKTPDQEWAFEQWKRAIEDQKRDVMLLQDRSDAIAKLSLIRARNLRQDKDQDTIDDASVMMDKSYTAIFHATREQARKSDTTTLTAKTLPAILRRGLFASSMPGQKAIDDRVVNPPRDTRAHKRGEAIRTIPSANISSLDWNQYTVTMDGTVKTVRLDPWAGAEDTAE